MKSKKIVFSYLFIVLIFFSSCSTIPILNVGYNMPLQGVQDLKGIKISIGTEDAREKKIIIGPGAVNDFKSFSGQVSLSLIQSGTNRIPVGLFEPDSLFVEAFTRRFENLGVSVVTGSKAGKIALIVLGQGKKRMKVLFFGMNGQNTAKYFFGFIIPFQTNQNHCIIQRHADIIRLE